MNIFFRILKAGKANVYSYPPPSHADVTRVLTKHVAEHVKAHNAPCYSIEHIALHLFGVNVYVDVGWLAINNYTQWKACIIRHNLSALSRLQENVCSDMGLTWTEGQPEETREANDALSTDFSELESEARDYISQIGVSGRSFQIRLCLAMNRKVSNHCFSGWKPMSVVQLFQSSF